MFRSSDHDPVLVGLKLGEKILENKDVTTNSYEVYFNDELPTIVNAEGGHYYVYRVDGNLVKEAPIATDREALEGLSQGLYILNIYGNGKCLQTKLLIP